jgi:septal ring factor EnvC (AmiA/AmiB activator)
MQDARARLDALLAQKRDSMIEQQGELKKLRRAAADLARSISELDDLIGKMDKTIAEQAGIEAYNRQLAEAQAQEERDIAAAEAQMRARAQQGQGQAPAAGLTPAPAAPSQLPPLVVERTAPPAQPSRTPAAEPRLPQTAQVPPLIERKPEPGPRVALANPGRLAPAVPFAKLKGRLPMPASGKRIAAFGERSDLGGTSKGVALETRPGAQITSPSDGWVVFAQEFRSYGQLLIINAGGGYHVVLAGLTRVDVTVGQFVLAGEPVGVMGSAAASVDSSNRAALKAADVPPALYIEIRKDGRPVDPDPWWVGEGAQRAQG